MQLKSLATLPLLALSLARPLAAQVLIAPIQLFLDDRAPLGTFFVYNRSQQPQEITISFRFGYPVSGPDGGLRMAYGDTLPLASRSMQGWVRAFPRQFVLRGGDRQAVRVTARAPHDLVDGTYWTRLVTTSTPQQPPPDSAIGGVSAHIIFRLEQVTTVLFRHGSVRTAVTADSPRVEMDSASVVVLERVAPGGNAPFFGKMVVRLLRPDGGEVQASTLNFAMYAPLVERFKFDRSKLPSGSYVVEARITSERDDIGPGDMLRIEPVVKRADFALP